jgi:hypothetical protein
MEREFAEVHTDVAGAIQQVLEFVNFVHRDRGKLSEIDDSRLAVFASSAVLAVVNCWIVYEACRREFLKRGIIMMPSSGAIGKANFAIDPDRFGISGLTVSYAEA